MMRLIALLWLCLCCKLLLVAVGVTHEALPATKTEDGLGSTLSGTGSDYQPGDRVSNFQLVERIQTLGQRGQQHAMRYHWHYSLPQSSDSHHLLPVRDENNKLEADENIDAIIEANPNINIGSSEITPSIPRAENRSHCFLNSSFCMEDNIFHGGHGDIWRAHRIDETTGDILPDELYVMKRMLVLERPDILRCALREIYFGKLLQQRSSFPRFVTFFTIPQTGEYWLIYRFEGISLQKMIYAVENQTSSTVLLRPSNIWRRLRSTKSGGTSLKGIIFQLISNVAELHSLGITHRDIKPSNILLNVDLKPKLMIADFSSAFNKDLLDQDRYYPLHGPSINEETLAYAPPEVLLSAPADAEALSEEELLGSIAYHPLRPDSYDIWSVGVVFLELLLGTSDIFNVDQRTASMIKQRLKKRGLHHPTLLKNALLLSSYSDYCIYRQEKEVDVTEESKSSSESAKPRRKKRGERLNDKVLDFITNHAVDRSLLLPSSTSSQESERMVTLQQQCSVREMAEAILRRDPLGIGFGDRWGLDLLVKLLQFDPMKRINMSEAIKHAYFQGAYVSLRDGSLFATADERNHYDKLVSAQMSTSSFSSIPSNQEADNSLSIFTDEFSSPSLLDGQLLFDEEMEVRKEEESAAAELDDSDISFFDELPIDLLIDSMVFTCSKCKRKFKGDWQACQQHVISRRHGQQCRYDAPEVVSEWQDWPSILYLHNEYVLDVSFPPCLSDHFLLPHDPHSGWCDLRGRRKYIEDYHAVYFEDSFKFFGVFDGHLGSFAARFAAHEIFRRFQGKLTKYNSFFDESFDLYVRAYSESTSQRLNAINSNSSSWQSLLNIIQTNASIAVKNEEQHISVQSILKFMREAFLETDSVLMASDDRTQYETVGGTTATIAMLFDHNEILIASVGDSRAVLCCQFEEDDSNCNKQVIEVYPIQLTLDHTPADPQEFSMVYERGGYVDKSSVIPRVNGKLAVSRSLGDNEFGSILSAEPDLLLFTVHRSIQKSEARAPHRNAKHLQATQCQLLINVLFNHTLHSSNNLELPALFLIIGSDGLWDVMTNAEASDLVCGFLLEVHSELHEFEDEDEVDIEETVEIFPFDTFQRVSKLLAHEALLRGSSDNIGVCVIDLMSKHITKTKHASMSLQQ